MYFPVSGVEVSPVIPPLVSFVLSSLLASAGISGAFLLLPFQMSVLHYTTPGVSPTNFIYNIVAIPGALYRYFKEGRMAMPLTWVIVAGTLPGVFAGAWIRINYLPNPRYFKIFVGLVLLYLGGRLLFEFMGWNKKSKERNQELNKKFAKRVKQLKEQNSGGFIAGLPPEAVVKTKIFTLEKVEYEFWGATYTFYTKPVFLLALVVGLIGGIYGIGGGAIIAPVCVSVLGLPVYTVAGAAMAGTFITSIAGVAYYHLLDMTTATQLSVAPDWKLGILFGMGGLVGTYVGAYLQKYLPEKLVKGLLTVIIIGLAISYIF